MHVFQNNDSNTKFFSHNLWENVKKIELSIQLICEKCIMIHIFTLCVQGIVFLCKNKFKMFLKIKTFIWIGSNYARHD